MYKVPCNLIFFPILVYEIYYFIPKISVTLPSSPLDNLPYSPNVKQGPPKSLPMSIYPITPIAHPNQTLLYNCIELLDEK